jgi:hypothetical protein
MPNPDPVDAFFFRNVDEASGARPQGKRFRARKPGNRRQDVNLTKPSELDELLPIEG